MALFLSQQAQSIQSLAAGQDRARQSHLAQFLKTPLSMVVVFPLGSTCSSDSFCSSKSNKSLSSN